MNEARRLVAIAAAAMLVVACGESGGTPTPSERAPSLRPSRSAQAWRRAEFGSPGSPFGITDLAAGPDGIAAIGRDRETGAPVLLTAPADAATWSLRRTDAPGPGAFAAVSEGPTGLHAAIPRDDGSLVIGGYTDRGATWTAVATIADDGTSRRSGRLAAVSASGVVAVAAPELRLGTGGR